MSKIATAIIAGGRGERLKPITDYIPKPMISIGDDEKLVLEKIIEWIKRFEIKDFVLLVGININRLSTISEMEIGGMLR